MISSRTGREEKQQKKEETSKEMRKRKERGERKKNSETGRSGPLGRRLRLSLFSSFLSVTREKKNASSLPFLEPFFFPLPLFFSLPREMPPAPLMIPYLGYASLLPSSVSSQRDKQR